MPEPRPGFYLFSYHLFEIEACGPAVHRGHVVSVSPFAAEWGMEAQRRGPILGCFKFADRGCWVTAVHFHSPLRHHPQFNSSWCRWSGPWGQASPVSLACSAGTKRQVWKLACDSFFSDFERQLIVLVTVFTTDRWFINKKKKMVKQQ